MKKYTYLVNFDSQTLERVGESFAVKGDGGIAELEFAIPSNFGIPANQALWRVFFKLPGERESLFETLPAVTATESGDYVTSWTISKAITQKAGRLAFSLAAISGNDIQWNSRTVIMQVPESQYQPESEEAEEPYTGRLAALEGSMASIRGEFAEVQDDFEELKETATLGTPIPESLVANMQEGRIYVYTGTETGYTAGHLYYYVNGTLTDGGVYGGTAVDATLTQSGQAADAKVTGDKIEEIKEDLSETSENAEKAIDSIEATTEQGLIDTSKLHITQYWIDPTNNILDSSISIPKRLVIIPVGDNSTISVSIPTVSTKRVAFCNSLTDGSPVYGVQQITGSLNAKFTNTNYKYFVIQLFINSDTDMDYTHYLDTAEISVFTAIDSIARKNINILLSSGDSLFHTENLKGLPILNSFSDIEIVTSAYDNSANFHNLVKTELCDTSNGYLVQTLLGDDGYGNNLYKYVTYPETLTYGAARRFGTPEHPIYEGFPTSVFTVIVTTNIHGVEHGSNWVIYNLLKKMLTEDSDMLRFFKKRVKLIWVPYICASGNYENADGININRDFPTTKDGTCTSIEGNLVKSVIDEYGNTADLHIDIHTFNTDGNYAKYFASWSFTDSEKLGNRSVLIADSVCTQYSKKYPNIELLKKEVVSAINTPTTCTYYTQTVYNVPSGTIEGALLMEGSPAGTSAYTSATAYLYDIVTQTICAMI